MNTGNKLKQLYSYMDQTQNIVKKVYSTLSKYIEETKNLSDKDEVNIFLKNLADNEFNKLYLYLKQNIETINTPIRVPKKGFDTIYKEKLEELIDTLNYLKEKLNEIYKKLEDFQEKLHSKRAENVSFKEFILAEKTEIEDYLKLGVNRILDDKLNFFKEELEKIREIEEPHLVIKFLKEFEKNVNLFIKEQLFMNISGLNRSLKDTLLKKAENYVEKLGIPDQKKHVLLDNLKVFLENYEDIYPLIYFQIPQISEKMFDADLEYSSLLDKFAENINSFRFLSIFLTGIILTLIGIYETLNSDVDMWMILSIVGIFFIFGSLVDALFFNKKYKKVFLQKQEEILIQSLRKNLDEIKTALLLYFYEENQLLIDRINEIINEELEVYSTGGKYLENMKNTIKSLRDEVYDLKSKIKTELS